MNVVQMLSDDIAHLNDVMAAFCLNKSELVSKLGLLITKLPKGSSPPCPYILQGTPIFVKTRDRKSKLNLSGRYCALTLKHLP